MTQHIKTIDEIVKETFDRFIPGFWHRAGTNEQLIRGFSGENHEMSKSISKTFNELFLNSATGQYLDDFGYLFKKNRKENETDEDYRKRLKAHYQLFLNAGIKKSMKETISIEFNIDESDIDIVEVSRFSGFYLMSTMEATDAWYGTGISADTDIFYKGTQSIQATATEAEVVTASLDRSLNLTSTFQEDTDAFKVWYYFDDVTKIDDVRFILSDLVNPSSENTIEIQDTDPQYGELIFLKKDFTNLSTTDFSSIQTIGIFTRTTAATTANYDWAEQGLWSHSCLFTVHLDLPSGFDLGLIPDIKILIDKIKPIGTHLKELTYTI